MTYRPCIVIPHYNHHLQAAPVIKRLSEQEVPVFMIDDGSHLGSVTAIRELCERFDHITLIELPKNRGKGAAVLTGFTIAQLQGFTHALQVDSDGQHDLNDIERFIEESKTAPDAIIAGYPVFDGTAPLARKLGRKLTDLMVIFQTWSFRFPDAMCGYRMYPVDAVNLVRDRHFVGSRMDFDTEILVKSHWLGVPCKFIDTKVIYPEHGASNFRMLADNIAITKMHTRLLIGMLRYFPQILRNKFR